MFLPLALALEAEQHREDQGQDDEEDGRRDGGRQELGRQVASLEVAARDEVFRPRRLEERRQVDDVVVAVDEDDVGRKELGVVGSSLGFSADHKSYQ